MLNVDGVVCGSYRCNLAGVDLNRQWAEPSRRLHPTICNTKQYIKKFMEERETILYCDFHGHSRKKNVFMYGCASGRRSVASNDKSKNCRLSERIFPKLMESTCPIF
jgi:hypothetical protein